MFAGFFARSVPKDVFLYAPNGASAAVSSLPDFGSLG
jgi:hypothetical protein